MKLIVLFFLRVHNLLGGVPKLYTPRDINKPPPFRPNVSSVGTYNCNLAKYLCSILNPINPDTYIIRLFLL